MKRILILLLPIVLFASPPLFVGGAGLFDIGGSNQGVGQLEYRGGHSTYHLHTLLGFNLTTDESVFGYFGLAYDLSLGDKYKATPSFSVGGYSRGNGKDLGSWVMFRPSFELSRAYTNHFRFGLNYSYLSNFGISNTNPGSHNLTLVLGIPLNIVL